MQWWCSSPSRSRALGEKLLPALDEERRADLAVERERLLELDLARCAAPRFDQLLGGPQPKSRLPRRAAALRPYVGCSDEVAIETAEREVLPPGMRTVPKHLSQLDLVLERGVRVQEVEGQCLRRFVRVEASEIDHAAQAEPLGILLTAARTVDHAQRLRRGRGVGPTVDMGSLGAGVASEETMLWDARVFGSPARRAGSTLHVQPRTRPLRAFQRTRRP